MIHATHIHGSKTSGSGREAEYLAGWQRARAELANLRKRLQDERSVQREQVRQQMIEELLGIADNFQAMVTHVPTELANNAWTQGVLHVARQVEQLLAGYDVEPIVPANEEFDPISHEAIEKIDQPEVSSGIVVEVVQRGYRVNGRVIRPAKVKVAA